MGEMIKLHTAGAEPTVFRTGLIAALDIGSSKIACFIGRVDDGKLRILGTAFRESQGIRSGMIVNLQDARESIRDAVDAAESRADTRIQNVLMSVSCGAPRSVTARVAMPLDGVLVSDHHIQDLLNEARINCQTDEHDIIHAAPISYVVDDARGVRDPRGMFCQRIGVSMHAVAVKQLPLQNLKLAVQQCHLNIVGMLTSSYASGLATLTPDEKQLGATVIDMGGGTTSVAVFMEGELVHADVVPLGGFHVTSDLARMLAAPLSAAERLKNVAGAALGDLDGNTDLVAVPQMGEDGEESVFRVPRSMLIRIIQPRIEEIFLEVQKRLRASGFDVVAGRRAVLTGGGSQLAGARELAQRVLNKQVRLARPQTFPGLAAVGAGPEFSTVLGLLIAGASTAPEALNPHLPAPQKNSASGGFFQKLVGGIFG
jgi:cell division protein FtsA